METRTILVDGLSVETTEAGVQAITKLQAALKDSQDAQVQLKATHASELKAKDTELASKDAEIDSLKGKMLDDAALDKRVKERADLISTAKKIADVDYTGKSDSDIRKTAVVSKLGADSIKDKSDDYIAARFDILAEDSKDPIRQALRSPAPISTTSQDQAFKDHCSYLEGAWKGEQKQESH